MQALSHLDLGLVQKDRVDALLPQLLERELPGTLVLLYFCGLPVALSLLLELLGYSKPRKW